VNSFWPYAFALVALRTADVGITFVVSPDLRWEMNPLVSVAGLGWTALIATNIFGVCVILGFYGYAVSRGGTAFPGESGYSIREFVSHYLFNERHSFRKIYYVVPYNKQAIIEYCGFVAIRVITVWSSLVVIHNLLVWRSGPYREIISTGKLWLIMYVLLIFLVILYSVLFFAGLYSRYRSSWEAGDT